MIHVELWLTVIGLAITLISFLWKTASIYKDIRYQIKENGKTITQLKESFPSVTVQDIVLIKFALFHMQQHLVSRDKYNPPYYNSENNPQL